MATAERAPMVRLICEECGEVGLCEDENGKLDAAYEAHIMDVHAPMMRFERGRK